MRDYALDDTTHAMLSSFASDPNGSVLLTGHRGSGLSTAISYLLNCIYGPTERPGEVYRLESGTIDEVRSLQSQIGLTRTNPKKPRMIVIDDAHTLTLEAQNAILKSLEEPPDRTHFILATPNPGQLLPTVMSRCRVIKLRRPLKAELQMVYKAHGPEAFNDAYVIADGWPAIVHEVLESDVSTTRQNIDIAKKFLSSSTAERVLLCKKMESDPDQIEGLLDGLMRICRATLGSMKSSREGIAGSIKWRDRVLLIHDYRELLHKKINKKLLLTSISLGFS